LLPPPAFAAIPTPTKKKFLTTKVVGWQNGSMLDIEVIEDPAAAEASLDPIRTRILQELAEPGSATQLAAKVGLPRQKVNYHLKALERHGLVELVEERRKGNVTERVLQATAASYLISPVALASVAPDPHRFSDRFSAFWLLALAGRMVQEVGKLIAGAAAARQKLATFAIDGEITFRTASDRAAFAEELGVTVTRLVDKYHDGGSVSTSDGIPAGAGRKHRLVVALHPVLKTPNKTLSAKEQDND
jgi:DNA-binding transcriptional ArsR family regulator